jgi:hypothetical protein
MNSFWKIFVAIFCYIAAVAGVGLAALNATTRPPSTTAAVGFGCVGAVFLLAAIGLTRRPRY